MKNPVTETHPILPVIPLDSDGDRVTRSSRVDPTEAGGPPPARRAPIYSSMLWRLTSLVAVVLALGGQGLAHPAAPKELRGIIHDYLLTNGERWHVSGEWSLQLKGRRSKGDFAAAFIGVPRDNPPLFPASAAHTHHVSIVAGDVAITEDANGNSILTISGPGTFAGNGNLQSTFTGSQVEVTIKGGNAISYSNFGMIIGPPATDHYGTETFHGLVTYQQ